MLPFLFVGRFTGQDIFVVAAGGISDGRGLAMALCLGANAVWVGTRFICAEEVGLVLADLQNNLLFETNKTIEEQSCMPLQLS